MSERKTSVAHHPEAHPINIRKVGVIGGGTTGSGIVVSFLDTGAKVTLVEANAEALDRSTNVVRFTYGNRVKKGQMSMEEALAIGNYK